ncbi:MAG: hypothetical protein WC466_09255 [Candidatus Izemoplasmatales bacterium]
MQEGNFSRQEELKKKYDLLREQVRASAAINNLINNRKKMEAIVGNLAIEISNNINFPFTLPPKKSCGCK